MRSHRQAAKDAHFELEAARLKARELRRAIRASRSPTTARPSPELTPLSLYRDTREQHAEYWHNLDRSVHAFAANRRAEAAQTSRLADVQPWDGSGVFPKHLRARPEFQQFFPRFSPRPGAEGSGAEAPFSALYAAPDARTEDQKQRIGTWLLSTPIRDVLPPSADPLTASVAVTRAVAVREVSAGEALVEQGMEGDSGIHVLFGCLAVIRDGAEVGQVGPGETVDLDIAVAPKPVLRSFTLQAKLHTAVVLVRRHELEDAMSTFREEQIVLHAQRLADECAVLRTVSKTKMRDLARLAVVRRLPAGSVVYAQGDRSVDSVLIIMEGQVALGRSFSFVSVNRWPAAHGESETRAVTSCRAVTVTTLGPGAVLGVEAVVKESERRFTARTKTDVELLQLAASPGSPFDAQVTRLIQEDWAQLCALLEKRRRHTQLSRKLESEGRRLVHESVGPAYVARTADTHGEKLRAVLGDGSKTARARLVATTPGRSSEVQSPMGRARQDRSPRPSVRLTHR